MWFIISCALNHGWCKSSIPLVFCKQNTDQNRMKEVKSVCSWIKHRWLLTSELMQPPWKSRVQNLQPSGRRIKLIPHNSKMQSDSCQSHLLGCIKRLALGIIHGSAGSHNKMTFYVERKVSALSLSVCFHDSVFILTSQLHRMQIIQDFWDGFVYCG